VRALPWKPGESFVPTAKTGTICPGVESLLSKLFVIALAWMLVDLDSGSTPFPLPIGLPSAIRLVIVYVRCKIDIGLATEKAWIRLLQSVPGGPYYKVMP
jgi:hypothetical protein